MAGFEEPPQSPSSMLRLPRSLSSLQILKRMGVMRRRMKSFSSSTRTSFESCRRSTQFSASRACGYCLRRFLDLTYCCAKWFICHWSVQLLPMTSRGWRLSSPMDIGPVLQYFMSPSATSLGRNVL
jgi:hypothetical protein